jgi:hypothetical protein
MPNPGTVPAIGTVPHRAPASAPNRHADPYQTSIADPAPLSGWHDSPLGVAVCDDCGRGWPCHLSAWGRPQRVSGCNVCGGDVHWNEGRAA